MIEGHEGWDEGSKGELDPKESRWAVRPMGQERCCWKSEGASLIRGLWEVGAERRAWPYGIDVFFFFRARKRIYFFVIGLMPLVL